MMHRKFVSRGLWIAFFGPDGVGKSAVIEEAKALLGSSFSGVTLLHFRPRFGRRGRNRMPVTDPHGKVPRGLLISLAKLLYWLVDCWWGYFAVIRPALRCSGLVVFDRYYPDILVDPRRYRLPEGCRGFARYVVSLAPCPDLCVLLDAPAEVVQRRKQEVSPAESQRQRLAYLAMLQFLPDKLVVSADGPVSEIARQVNTAVSAFTTTASAQEPDPPLCVHL
jgi:thymidylate kinase